MARDIVAIDVHVHLFDEFTQKAKGDRTAQMARYWSAISSIDKVSSK